MLDELIAQCRLGLQQAAADSQHEWRLFTFANVDQNGEAVNRYVVLRDSSDKDITFFSDLRSEKIAALKKAPLASLCFFSPSAGLQLQVKARVSIFSGEENIAKKLWDETPWYSLQCYHMKEKPGQPLPAPFMLDAESMDVEEARKYFAVLKCRMLKWDILSLQKTGNQRAIVEFDEKGHITSKGWVAP